MTMCPWTVPLDPRLELWDVAYGYSAESRSRSGGTDGKGTWGGESVLIEGCEQDWKQLPQPDLPLTVELDGGFVHSSERSSRTDGWFEEITGQSMTGKGAPSSTRMNPLLPGLIGDGFRCNKLASIRTGRIISTCSENLPSSVSFWTTACSSMIASSRRHNAESTLEKKGLPLCCSGGCLNIYVRLRRS
jgi:hypothetical protein